MSCDSKRYPFLAPHKNCNSFRRVERRTGVTLALSNDKAFLFELRYQLRRGCTAKSRIKRNRKEQVTVSGIIFGLTIPLTFCSFTKSCYANVNTNCGSAYRPLLEFALAECRLYRVSKKCIRYRENTSSRIEVQDSCSRFYRFLSYMWSKSCDRI